MGPKKDCHCIICFAYRTTRKLEVVNIPKILGKLIVRDQLRHEFIRDARDTAKKNIGSNTLSLNLYYDKNIITTYEPKSGVDFFKNFDLIDYSGCKLMHQIMVQRHIIRQTNYVLKFGQELHDNYIGSYTHLDTERVLKMAETKKQAIVNILKGSGKEPNNNNRAIEVVQGTATVDRFQFSVNYTDYHTKTFYMCILHYKQMIYATHFTKLDSCKQLVFDGPFKFVDLPQDFTLKLDIYVIQVDKKKSNEQMASIDIPLIKICGNVNFGFKGVIDSDKPLFGTKLHDLSPIKVQVFGKFVPPELQTKF